MNLEDILKIGTRAAQPAASSVGEGSLYSVSDENYLVEQSRGGVWITYAGSGSGSSSSSSSNRLISPIAIDGEDGLDGFDGMPGSIGPAGSGGGATTGYLNYVFTPPVLADFTWINQGTATAVTSNGGILLSTPGVSGDNIRCLVKARPTVPYTVTVAFVPLFNLVNYCGVGLFLRESSSGKMITFGFGNSLGWDFTQWVNTTTWASSITTVAAAAQPLCNSRPYFMRLADNGTSRISSISPDGFNWIVLHSISNIDYITPDQIGFQVGANNATPANSATMHLLSWKEA